MSGKKTAPAENEEVTEKKNVALVIDMAKGDIQRLSSVLKTIHYGKMSFNGKMALVKNGLTIIQKSKELEEERKLAYDGFIPEEYKKLEEKQTNGEDLTPEESDRFSKMNQQYGIKLNEMFAALNAEQVPMKIIPLSMADYKILMEANESAINGEGFVYIYQYLTEQED